MNSLPVLPIIFIRITTYTDTIIVAALLSAASAVFYVFCLLFVVPYNQ